MGKDVGGWDRKVVSGHLGQSVLAAWERRSQHVSSKVHRYRGEDEEWFGGRGYYDFITGPEKLLYPWASAVSVY